MLFSILIATILPWGKDADLAIKNTSKTTHKAHFIAEWGIHFHKTVISEADGPRSHYYPSSSTYTLEAMRKHGFFWGYLMGCDRLMRENDDPWIHKTTFNQYGPLKVDLVK